MVLVETVLIYWGGNDISANGISANILYLNAQHFRYIPWTRVKKTNGDNVLFADIVSAVSTVATPTNPSPSTGHVFKYYYSVVGNMGYIRYSYQSGANTGSSGAGFYNFDLPYIFKSTGSYPINNDITPAITLNNNSQPEGADIGRGNLAVWGADSAINTYVYRYSTDKLAVWVRALSTGSNNVAQIGVNNWHASNMFAYLASNAYYSFECAFPIN